MQVPCAERLTARKQKVVGGARPRGVGTVNYSDTPELLLADGQLFCPVHPRDSTNEDRGHPLMYRRRGLNFPLDQVVRHAKGAFWIEVVPRGRNRDTTIDGGCLSLVSRRGATMLDLTPQPPHGVVRRC